MNKEEQQILQEKYLEFQMLNQQIKQIQQQLQIIDNQMSELIIAKEGLAQLEKTETGSDMYSSLSPGMFIKTQLKDNKKILLNVGAGIGVPKSIKESTELIETQIREIKEVQRQLLENIKTLNSRASVMEKEFSKSLK